MKKDIIIFMGKTCSGKDTLVKKIQEKYGYNICISYTTRKMRKNESNGKEYIFLKSNQEFNQLISDGILFEKTEYITNDRLLLYGIGEKSFVENNINMMILNPHGAKQILDNPKFKDRVILFYLDIDLQTRFFRYLDRDFITDNNKIELVDRILRDEKDFLDIEHQFPDVIKIDKNDINNVELINNYILENDK